MSSVFITGVSAGIGRALAECFLHAGDQVYGVSRRSPEALVAAGLHFASVDLHDHVAIVAALSELLEDVAELDLCVLNAGVLGAIGDMSQQSLGDLRDVLEVNLWANKTILDFLLRPERTLQQVIAISSGAGVVAKPGFNGYAISKAGLNMMIQLYAAENPATHFTCLSPGAVDTAMQDILCSFPDGDRYPTISSLRARRGTQDMPDAASIATRIADVAGQLPTRLRSGDYTDIRDWPAHW